MWEWLGTGKEAGAGFLGVESEDWSMGEASVFIKVKVRGRGITMKGLTKSGLDGGSGHRTCLQLPSNWCLEWTENFRVGSGLRGGGVRAQRRWS